MALFLRKKRKTCWQSVPSSCAWPYATQALGWRWPLVLEVRTRGLHLPKYLPLVVQCLPAYGSHSSFCLHLPRQSANLPRSTGHRLDCRTLWSAVLTQAVAGAFGIARLWCRWNPDCLAAVQIFHQKCNQLNTKTTSYPTGLTGCFYYRSSSAINLYDRKRSI